MRPPRDYPSPRGRGGCHYGPPGPEAELDRLLASAAEDVFARTQPRAAMPSGCSGKTALPRALAVYDAVIATGTDEQQRRAIPVATILTRAIRSLRARRRPCEGDPADPRTRPRAGPQHRRALPRPQQAGLAALGAEAKMMRYGTMHDGPTSEPAGDHPVRQKQLPAGFPTGADEIRAPKDQVAVGSFPIGTRSWVTLACPRPHARTFRRPGRDRPPTSPAGRSRSRARSAKAQYSRRQWVATSWSGSGSPPGCCPA